MLHIYYILLLYFKLFLLIFFKKNEMRANFQSTLDVYFFYMNGGGGSLILLEELKNHSVLRERLEKEKILFLVCFLLLFNYIEKKEGVFYKKTFKFDTIDL